MNTGKRSILVVDDSDINREMLAAILEDEYNVLTAENGAVGLDILSRQYKQLSLVILDIFMPVLTGYEFLEHTRNDAMLSSVPVIVATASDNPEDETKCLDLGASDFVTKPYNSRVVLGRVHSIIKLHESTAILSDLEYDSLTGLYTMPAFYHHVKATFERNPETSFDLSVSNIRDFRTYNRIYGNAAGDEVLRFIGRSMLNNAAGIVAARDGDKFYALVESDDSPSKREGLVQIARMIESDILSDIHAQVGLYQNVDTSLPVSVLCDRALSASAGADVNRNRPIGIYRDELEQAQIKKHLMEKSFDEAIKQQEFAVWLQPKYDIFTEKIVAAEALIRWIKPDGTMISPGQFIPLFEQDGLIRQLDEYMFRRVCQFQKKRMDAGKQVIPISINLSRETMLRPGMVKLYVDIASEQQIPLELIPLELTESSFADEPRVKGVSAQLSDAGFSLHMDDFGTGFSSLSSLTVSPFDTVKIDKSLIDNIDEPKGKSVVRHTISFSHEMGMTVVAEGVEEAWQVDFLRASQCDIVQGFYYSRPLAKELFEEKLDESLHDLPADLEKGYEGIRAQLSTQGSLSEKQLRLIKRMSEDMMEGFFVYQANAHEALLFANAETLRIFGCDTYDEFLEFTNGSFKGIVHPDDYDVVENSIFQQVVSNDDNTDKVRYRIIRKDGSIRYVDDRGHCFHTQEYGDVFCVYIIERD